MDHSSRHNRARSKGVNRFVYWLFRVPSQIFCQVYLRMARLERNNIPAQGPAIIASNHRSFFDPFIVGMMTRRPMYYVAKRELFEIHPVVAWVVSALGAFPVSRGAGDGEMIATATELLERGELVLIFPEGTRTRPGGLGRAKRGVGRLALATGAPVVPVAVIGTEAIRRGWRLRPHKVRARAGKPLEFERNQDFTAQEAQAVTDRVWACVELQWQWLGGQPTERDHVVAETPTHAG